MFCYVFLVSPVIARELSSYVGKGDEHNSAMCCPGISRQCYKLPFLPGPGPESILKTASENIHVLTIALARGYWPDLLLLCLCPNCRLCPDYRPIALACCYAFVLSLRPGLVHLHLPLPWAVDLALDYRSCRGLLPIALACCFARPAHSL